MNRLPFYLLFTASGFAGLIYESIWTHYLKLFLGHAAYAQSLVLIVFMGGLAAGSAWCAHLSSRIARPLLAYALIEAAIGLCALFFHPLYAFVIDWSHTSLLPALASEPLALAAKLAISGLLILPQSLLLGMTFPLMSAALVRAHPRAAGESVAMLYFTNSLGASIGVLASGFILIAAVGLPGTLRTAGAINLVLAALVWIALPGRGYASIPARAGAETPAQVSLLLWVAFFTGLASFVYEISWIRMLSLVLGASTQSFELMLATFILGLASGGWAVRRRIDRVACPERLLGWVQVVMGLLALITLPLYNQSFGLMEILMKGLARSDAGYVMFNLGGAGIAALIMLPASFCAGMTLPLLTGALLRHGAGESAIGKVYAANTIGAIAGVVLAVHAGMPLLGLKGSLIAASMIDAGLGLYLLARFAPTRTNLVTTATACVLLFTTVSIAVDLDANKMTAGVFRYGELSTSRETTILFKKDGKTATVHLVLYPDAKSLRTNGKSDGAINLPEKERGSDEITMVLTGALPLALKPEAKTAAVIGIGTGLTTHTLLQSGGIERVETVEIEAAMAEASRGFLPRNSSAFADPRGSILIDDAKTFFSTRNRRYDIVISEPSNPWVSGVSNLFTREFYTRIRTHINPGGVLVQWFQLYEIDASLLASVMGALGEVFPHYAVFAPSDHDLLIVASAEPLPFPVQPRIFDDPGLAQELRTVHVLNAGDLDARYLGSRATLEPLFASYGMPANSDYYPILDLNAARHRFTERSATDVVALLNLGVPLLEMLDPQRGRRAPHALYSGAYSFARIENLRLAQYARAFLLEARAPVPENVPTQLQKDLDIVKLRLAECRDPRNQDIWLHSMIRVASALNPFLEPREAVAVWDRLSRTPCFAGLREFQRRWIALVAAIGARDGARMFDLGATLLATQPDLNREAREYLLMAAMTGALASGRTEELQQLWDAQAKQISSSADAPAFRLLRCHAERAATACAATFSAYARR